MGEVARVRTPITARELIAELVPAFRAEFGRLPTLPELEGMAALKWFETDGGRATDNNNPGNIHASNAYKASGRPWFRPIWYPPPTEATSEKIRRLHELMKKGKVPDAFRSYASLGEGLRDFARLLRTTFGDLLAAFGSGDMVRAGAVAHEAYTPDASAATLATAYTFRRDQLRQAGAFAGVSLSSGGASAGAGAVAVVGAVALVVLAIAAASKGRKR